MKKGRRVTGYTIDIRSVNTSLNMDTMASDI